MIGDDSFLLQNLKMNDMGDNSHLSADVPPRAARNQEGIGVLSLETRKKKTKQKQKQDRI